MTSFPRRIALLGSTGSIGRQTLDVVRCFPEHFRVVALAARSNISLLTQQAQEFSPAITACFAETPEQKMAAREALPNVIFGEQGLLDVAIHPDVDIVVAATSGLMGLAPTLAAIKAGKTIALANKETLVMAGHLVMQAAQHAGVAILPVDSEHSAIWQCLRGERTPEVKRLLLTASGGPFRRARLEELRSVTVEAALCHPTWRMGPKITIDSATLMNKALEVIEARWLFDLAPEQIDVIIHPESVIHSFVEFTDGSVVAQLSPPDMRLPIQYALTYPERMAGPARRLNWSELGAWQFEQPDHETFPAIQLGYEVARRGGTCGAVLNAANEAAVGKFLAGELAFLDIVPACRAALDHHPYSATPTLTELARLDRWARQEVGRWTALRNPTPTRPRSS